MNRSALRHTSYNGTQINVLRIGTGVFTGIYTLDENNNFVFETPGAKTLWFLCALPVFSWAVLIYLLCSHEKIHCLNFRAILHHFETHHEESGISGDFQSHEALADLRSSALHLHEIFSCCAETLAESPQRGLHKVELDALERRLNYNLAADVAKIEAGREKLNQVLQRARNEKNHAAKVVSAAEALSNKFKGEVDKPRN